MPTNTQREAHQPYNGHRWGPRNLDLDWLLYDDKCVQLSDLILPHLGLRERNFVLYPLYECVPPLDLPPDG